jgi:hypothetical protein
VEGILLEDVSVVEGTDNLIDCIFCVHLQRQYSASRDLQAFLKTYNNDVKSIEDESAKKYLLALQKGRENEKKLNDSYMKNKYGQRVNFGDIIQVLLLVLQLNRCLNLSLVYCTAVSSEIAKIHNRNRSVGQR